MKRPNKKPSSGSDKYPPVVLSSHQPLQPAPEPEKQEVVFGREIFNLSVDLIKEIEDFIAQEKRAGKMMWDEKAGKERKINKSLWARDVFRQALKDAGYVPTPETRRGE